MIGANDEGTTPPSGGDGKTEITTADAAASPEMEPETEPDKTIAVSPVGRVGAEPIGHTEIVESGVLEIIDATPTPVVPVLVSTSAQESTRRPPPVPRTRRPSESGPLVAERRAPPRVTETSPPQISSAQAAPGSAPVRSVPPLATPPGSAPSSRVPVAPSLASPGSRGVPMPPVSQAPRPVEPETFAAESAIADARKRVEQPPSGDRLALARARTELGILLEVGAGDTAAALAEYRAAHGIAANLAAPLNGARRLTPLHPTAPALALLEAELHLQQRPAVRAARAIELGMLSRAAGPANERTWQAYREALAIYPSHPGALRGLESALAGARGSESAAQMEALANHREVMATLFRSDAQLSAWMEVERGQLLEKLGRMDAARAAFESALALDGGIGPVRDAYTRHLLLQGQIEPLIKAWATEATLETDGPRAARLLYSAGRLASERLDQKTVAIDLFERAVATEAAAASIRRAALRELFALYEALGNHEATVATGNRLLAYARENETVYWRRRLIPPCEALERHADVALHAQHVLAAEPTDEAMPETLDRAYVALGQHEQRVSMFTDLAARAPVPQDRLALLLRAADIAEHAVGRADLALSVLRSAFASDASSADATDGIARLLTPAAPPALTDPDDPSRVRARIDFYLEAAAAAPDSARKVAHLEKLALIWEDEVRTPDRALTIFNEILAIEPRRRSAVLGLARCAGRAGNAQELLRALVMEADLAADDPALERSLLLRAADVASQQVRDVETALDLVKRVLARSPGEPAALRAAFQVYDRAGHAAEALAHLRALLAQKNKTQSAYALQTEIARFLEQRLHRTGEALTAWRDAHRLEPTNPTPRGELRRILLGNGDFRAVAEEMAALGMATADPVERAELLLDAAEIYDDRLGDAERAIPLLTEARVGLPGDLMIIDRLDRACLRAGKRSERLALLHSADAADPRSQFALAALQAEERDPTKALKPLAELSQQRSTCVASLRVLEHAVRRTERWGELDQVLRRQVDCFTTVEAKLGSLFELLALEEYDDAGTPEGQQPARELLAKLAPDDLLAHELYLRNAGLHRESATAGAVVQALGRLAEEATDPMAGAAFQLAAGLILEKHEGMQEQKEALVAFATAHEAWPDSVAAARGARRSALRLSDTATFIKASAALGALEHDPALRCARLLEAADAAARQADSAPQAFDFICRALAEDANHAAAADAVIAAVERGHDAGRASEALRSALDRTTNADQAAKLGLALAHIALRKLGDETVALEALRRARKRAPKHVSTLLALAEIGNSMGLQAEAAEAATAALGIAREPADKLRATTTLAEIHVRMSAFRDTARREVREAEKLAEQVGAAGDAVARLGAVYQALGDDASAERVLVDAVVLDGEDHTALDKLCSLFGSGREAGEHVVRALHKAMALAESAGKTRRPEWLATLGKVEAIQLGLQAQGLAHLHEALDLGPKRVETYQALADALGPAHDEALRELVALLGRLGCAAATTEQVGAVLGIVASQARQAQRPNTVAAAEALLGFFTRPTPSTGTWAWPKNAPTEGSLSRPTLRSLAGETNAPLLDLASALSEPVGKVLRHDPEALGTSVRERLTTRTAHPLRALAERVARAFGELRFDIYVEATRIETPRLLATDPPALVLPQGFDGLPDAEQAATLARLLTYVALDVPWLDGASKEDTDGILFGGLRAVSESWGKEALSSDAETAAANWRPRLARAMSRKVKRNLEELAERLRPRSDSSTWRHAVRAAALKASYAVTGDLGASLHPMMVADSQLRDCSTEKLAASILATPTLADLITFALSEDATDLQRRVGTV